MKTIGLRELNHNPSRAVACVRSGTSLVVTDHGRPVLRMVPEVEHPDTLQRMLAAGEVWAPAEPGMPEIEPELAPNVDSLSDVLIADRDRERNR